MMPDRVSNPGPLTYELSALPIVLRGPALNLLSYAPITTEVCDIHIENLHAVNYLLKTTEAKVFEK